VESGCAPRAPSATALHSFPNFFRKRSETPRALFYKTAVSRAEPDHYATLGLDHRCTTEQIRAAYRLLAKRHHPDLNPGCTVSPERTRALNAAHEILSDPDARRAYDRELAEAKKAPRETRGQKTGRHLAQEMFLRVEEFLRGTTLEVRVKDPANPQGAETYELTVPPGTAPGAKFRVPREGAFGGGFITVRVKARPDFRFKTRGSDLRCDLKIKPERAAQGGVEMVPGANGNALRVNIPRGAGRGEIIRVPGEGLPKPRGGRGDLLVRIT
jgi:curved DNA-binding protein